MCTRSYMHFLRAFEKYSFLDLQLQSQKKLRAVLDFFFTDRTFFRPIPYPIDFKIFFKLLVIKSHKFHGDGVKNESARTKKCRGAPNAAPQPVQGAQCCPLIYKIDFRKTKISISEKNNFFSLWYQCVSSNQPGTAPSLHGIFNVEVNPLNLEFFNQASDISVVF